MEKLKMQTTNVVDENIRKIGALFPNCLTETLDEKGRPQAASCFSMYAFQELKEALKDIKELRFIFTSPTFTAEKAPKQQLIHREEREKLLRQIEALEKRCRIEKQTRRKYELHQQLWKLKTLLAE